MIHNKKEKEFINEEVSKEPNNDHVECHVVHDGDEKEFNQQQHEEPNIALYALIKYISTILIVIVVLYFIAVYVLPVVREYINK